MRPANNPAVALQIVPVQSLGIHLLRDLVSGVGLRKAGEFKRDLFGRFCEVGAVNCDVGAGSRSIFFRRLVSGFLSDGHGNRTGNRFRCFRTGGWCCGLGG